MLFIWLILSGPPSLAPLPEDPPVAALFTELSCIKCHTVEIFGIETTHKEPEKALDLSKGAIKATDAGQLKAFLLREGELDGKKHKAKFKGDDGQMETMLAWLLRPDREKP